MKSWYWHTLKKAFSIFLLLGAARVYAVPLAPASISPPANSKLTNRQVAFSWAPVVDPDQQPVRYELVVYRPGAPTQPVAVRLSISPDSEIVDDGYVKFANGLESASSVVNSGGFASAGVSFVPGRHGNAASITGSNYISFPAAQVLNVEQGTVEFFTSLNHDIQGVTNFPCFYFYEEPQGEAMGTLVSNAGAVYGYTLVGHERDVIAPTNWHAGEWHHVAFSWGPQGQFLYLDGTLAASLDTAVYPVASDSKLFIGNCGSGSSRSIDGLIDDLRISAYQRRQPSDLRSSKSDEIFLSGGAYEWKVRALTPAGVSAWSNPVSFQVDRTSPQKVALTGKVVQSDFPGLSVQWDGLFLNPANTSHGLDEQDLNMTKERIRQLGVSQIRMLVSLDWFRPAIDQTTFDSIEMQSVYRQLAVCADLGVEVNIVIWERPRWIVNHWTDDSNEVALSIGMLIQELYKRGYSNVKYLTAISEPSSAYSNLMSFTDYAHIQNLVKSELNARRLSITLLTPDVSEVSADSEDGWVWFSNSVAELYDQTGIYSSHNYVYDFDSAPKMSSYVQRRVAQLDAAAATAGGAAKRYALSEYGTSGFVGSFTTTDVDTFERGFYLAEAAIRAFSARAWYINVWCLHDMWYGSYWTTPAQFMRYGLWRYKDQNWTYRPSFHAYHLLSRFIPAHSQVLEVASADSNLIPGAIRRPDGRWAIWLVNRDDGDMNALVDLSSLPTPPISAQRYRYENVPASLPENSVLGPMDSVSFENGRALVALPGRTITALLTDHLTTCSDNPRLCDDGNICTTDVCNSSALCEHTNNTLPCDDHDPCTVDDACQNGVCAGRRDENACPQSDGGAGDTSAQAHQSGCGCQATTSTSWTLALGSLLVLLVGLGASRTWRRMRLEASRFKAQGGLDVSAVGAVGIDPNCSMDTLDPSPVTKGE